MNDLSPLGLDQPAGVKVADDYTTLDRFLDADCAALVWRRNTPADVQDWLDRVAPDVLPSGRVVVPSSAVEATAANILSGMPPCAARDWLLADVTYLAKVFSGLVQATFLRIRLDVIETNACRRFHVDAITARLVCTYRGTGTQYGTSPNGHDPAYISTVATGAPILMRGSHWPEQPASGLLHRSPPIEGTGETRLVLVLDPVSDPDEDQFTL